MSNSNSNSNLNSNSIDLTADSDVDIEEPVAKRRRRCDIEEFDDVEIDAEFESGCDSRDDIDMAHCLNSLPYEVFGMVTQFAGLLQTLKLRHKFPELRRECDIALSTSRPVVRRGPHMCMCGEKRCYLCRHVLRGVAYDFSVEGEDEYDLDRFNAMLCERCASSQSPPLTAAELRNAKLVESESCGGGAHLWRTPF